MSSAGLHYPPVQQAECQPGLLAGCGKVNGGGKTSYCVTLERNGEGRPSVSPGLPYPQSKWTRAARGEAADTHRAKPSERNGRGAADARPSQKEMGLDSTKTHIHSAHCGQDKANSKNFGSGLRVFMPVCFLVSAHYWASRCFKSRWRAI